MLCAVFRSVVLTLCVSAVAVSVWSREPPNVCVDYPRQPIEDLRAREREEALAGYARSQLPTGPLYCAEGNDARVEWAHEQVPSALERVEARLGRRRGRPFTTVVVGTAFELPRLVKRLGGGEVPSFALGVAIPSLDVLIVRADVAPRGLRGGIGATLAHEIAHLVVRRDPRSFVPRWLDEGLAMWASEGSLPPEDEAELAGIARVHGLYPLAELERSFPLRHAASTVAYRQSLHIVRYLEEVHGAPAIVALVDALEAGESFEAALAATVGLDSRALAEEFRIWAAARVSWVRVLFAWVNSWTILGPLALAAAFRHARKRRRQMRELAAAEAAADAGDPAASAASAASAADTGTAVGPDVPAVSATDDASGPAPVKLAFFPPPARPTR